MASPARIRLVVDADGFGTSAARDLGVVAGHRHGIVTSTSVLGNAANAQAVAATLKAEPRLGTGVLLTLVGGAPVAPAAQVASLLGDDGSLLARPRDFVLAWAKAAVREADLVRELDAQVALWRDLGLAIDHLATKHDLAALPIVSTVAEQVARRHGIAGVRTIIERPTLAWATDMPRGLVIAALGSLAWYSRRRMGARRHGPQTWGHFEVGRLDEIRLLEIVGRMGPGAHEIMCTPDLADDGQGRRGPEVEALCSERVRAALQRRGVELCRWADLF